MFGTVLLPCDELGIFCNSSFFSEQVNYSDAFVSVKLEIQRRGKELYLNVCTYTPSSRNAWVQIILGSEHQSIANLSTCRNVELMTGYTTSEQLYT